MNSNSVVSRDARRSGGRPPALPAVLNALPLLPGYPCAGWPCAVSVHLKMVIHFEEA